MLLIELCMSSMLTLYKVIENSPADGQISPKFHQTVLSERKSARNDIMKTRFGLV